MDSVLLGFCCSFCIIVPKALEVGDGMVAGGGVGVRDWGWGIMG